MAEINLAPGTEYVALARKRRQRVYGIAVVLLIAIGVVWGGLFLVQQRLEQNKREVQSGLAGVEAEITRLGDEARRVELFADRLEGLAVLLDKHITWDPFLADLERLLPPPVVMDLVQVDVSQGNVSIQGTTPDVEQVAQTLASLVSGPGRLTLFPDAKLNGIVREEIVNEVGETVAATYNFAAELTLETEKIRYGQ